MTDIFVEDMKATVERERRRSRYRDRMSRERVHPITWDVRRIVDFVAARRGRRRPEVLALLIRASRRVDTDALRQLIALIRYGGRCDMVMWRRCDRVESRCNAIDLALAIGRARGHAL